MRVIVLDEVIVRNVSVEVRVVVLPAFARHSCAVLACQVENARWGPISLARRSMCHPVPVEASQSDSPGRQRYIYNFDGGQPQ